MLPPPDGTCIATVLWLPPLTLLNQPDTLFLAPATKVPHR
jgi:hypothetical protein